MILLIIIVIILVISIIAGAKAEDDIDQIFYNERKGKNDL